MMRFAKRCAVKEIVEPNLCPTCHGSVCHRCGGYCAYCGMSTGCHAHYIYISDHAKTACLLTADQQAQCDRLICDESGKYLFDDLDYDNRLDTFDWMAGEFRVLAHARKLN